MDEQIISLRFMDEKTLQVIKQKLLDEKSRLERELLTFSKRDSASGENYTSEFPQFGSDEGENAAEVADFESRLSVEHTLELTLRDVNKALKRMVDGTYGICKYCGNPIEEQRLLIRPMSSSCVNCKKKLKGE